MKTKNANLITKYVGIVIGAAALLMFTLAYHSAF